MRKVITSLLLFLVSIPILLTLIFILESFVNERSQNPQKTSFAAGNKPPELSGFYKGSAAFYTASWKGKEFNKMTHTGINVFSSNKRFAFKTYYGKGIQDKSTNVLKIDYNTEQNNLLLKPVLDELVEVSPGKYLGKALLRIIPGFPFTLAYFELTK